MMEKVWLWLTLVGFLSIFANGYPIVTQDQRQEGETNVQVDLKGVQILALVDSDVFDDYLHYDYAYDYADFTIKPVSKPPTSSTPKPSPTTSASISTATTPESQFFTTPVTPVKELTITTVTPVYQEPNPTQRTNKSSHSEISATVTPSLSIGVTPTPSSEPESPVTPLSIVSPSSVIVEKPRSPVGKFQGAKRRIYRRPDTRVKKRCPTGFIMNNGRCFKDIPAEAR